MPDGRIVKQVAWVPTRHPMSGGVNLVQQIVIDSLVTEEQATKLSKHFERKSARGSLSLRRK